MRRFGGSTDVATIRRGTLTHRPWCDRYARDVIRTAYLRVYLEADSAEVRGLPEAVPVGRGVTDLGYGLTSESPGEDAYTAEWGGVVYRCPRTPQVRVLEGLLAIRAASSQLGSHPLFTESAAASARARLGTLRRSGRGTSHILTSAWHVPIRWFVPFDAAGRDFVGGDQTRIRYRALACDGVDRLSHAIEILDQADVPSTIIDEVDELKAWLGDFDRSSMLELDYGSVARAFTDTELMFDESCDDLWRSLEALAADDWDEAGERYGRLVTRWAVPMAVAYSN